MNLHPLPETQNSSRPSLPHSGHKPKAWLRQATFILPPFPSSDGNTDHLARNSI